MNMDQVKQFIEHSNSTQNDNKQKKSQRYLQQVSNASKNTIGSGTSLLYMSGKHKTNQSMTDLKALKMKLLQVKAENQMLQKNLDKQQTLSFNMFTDQIKNKNKKSLRKNYSTINLNTQKQEVIAPNQNSDQCTNIVISQKQFIIKKKSLSQISRHASQKSVDFINNEIQSQNQKGKPFKSQFQSFLLKQQKSMRTLDLQQIDEGTHEQDDNKYFHQNTAANSDFKINKQMSQIKSFKMEDSREQTLMDEEADSFGIEHFLDCFKQAENLNTIKLRKTKTGLQLAQQSNLEQESQILIEKRKNCQQFDKSQFTKSHLQNSSERLQANQQFSKETLEKEQDIKLENQKSNDIDQTLIKTVFQKQKIHKYISRSPKFSNQNQKSNRLQQQRQSEINELNDKFKQDLNSGFLNYQESKMFQSIHKKESYPDFTIDFQNSLTLNEPSQMFSPSISLKSMNDQESNVVLDQKISKNYKIQNFISSAMKQYPQLFFNNRDLKGKKVSDFINLNRMYHPHLHQLRRLRRTVSINLFQNLIDNNISIDYLYKCDVRDSIQPYQQINNLSLSKLHNYDKNNNLLKMRSGQPQLIVSLQDKLLKKILVMYKAPKIQKSKFKSEDLYIQTEKVLTQKTLPQENKRTFELLLNNYHYSSYIMRTQSQLKFELYNKRDQQAALLEQRVINKYNQYKKLQFYERKAILQQGDLPKDYQIYKMILSKQIDNNFFRDQGYKYQAEFFYLCHKIHKIQEIMEVKKQQYCDMNSKHLSNKILRKKLPKINLLSKTLGYRLGQKIYIKMAQTIEKNYGQFRNQGEPYVLRDSYKYISTLFFDLQFKPQEIWSPILLHEQYKFPQKHQFDLRPVQDHIYFSQIKRDPKRLESKKRVRSGSKQNFMSITRAIQRSEEKEQAKLQKEVTVQNQNSRPSLTTYKEISSPPQNYSILRDNEEKITNYRNSPIKLKNQLTHKDTMQLTVEVWQNKKLTDQVPNQGIIKQLNDPQSPSLKPRTKPSLVKYKNISSQSDTALEQATKYLGIDNLQQPAKEIQLFKSISYAGGNGKQNKQIDNSSTIQSQNNLMKPQSKNNRTIRRKSQTQIDILISPPIQGSDDNPNSGEDEILRDVMLDFIEYQKQGTQVSQFKFEINNIQRQTSRIIQKKKTQKLKEQVQVQEKSKEKKAFKAKPLIGEIKSQSFTDEYELLVRNLGKHQAQLQKSKQQDKITQKTKSQNLLPAGFMTCKEFKEQDEEGTSYLNDSFSFSSSEFLSMEQSIESKDSSNSESEVDDDEMMDQSSVVTSLNFKSMSSNLQKRFMRDNTYGNQQKLEAEKKKKERLSQGVNTNNSFKNIQTQKFLTGSHSNDALIDTFVSANIKNGVKKRISWFSKQSGKKKSEKSTASKRLSQKRITKSLNNTDEEQMKKVIQALNQKNLTSLKDYFKRFIGLNIINWRDNEGNTLLHLCIGINFVDGAEFLINMGSNINAQNNIGNTPLHNAKYLNLSKMVDFLIRFNAKQAIQNAQGLTPWDIDVN